MRKISFLYFNALEAFLHEIWLFYCEKLLFLRAEDDLLNMDYFLNEDDLFDDEAGVEGFYIF